MAYSLVDCCGSSITRGAPNVATTAPIVNGKAQESSALQTDLMFSSLVSSIYKQCTTTISLNAYIQIQGQTTVTKAKVETKPLRPRAINDEVTAEAKILV